MYWEPSPFRPTPFNTIPFAPSPFYIPQTNSIEADLKDISRTLRKILHLLENTRDENKLNKHI